MIDYFLTGFPKFKEDINIHESFKVMGHTPGRDSLAEALADQVGSQKIYTKDMRIPLNRS